MQMTIVAFCANLLSFLEDMLIWNLCKEGGLKGNEHMILLACFNINKSTEKP